MTALSRLLKAAAGRPWRAVIGDDVDSCAAYVDDVGGDNIFMATAYGSGYCTTAKLKSLLLKSRASTKFAVLAVNNFEALVEAVSIMKDHAHSCPECDGMAKKVLAAIESAAAQLGVSDAK